MNRDDLVGATVSGRNPNSKGWVRANCPLCEIRTGAPDRKASFGLNVRSLWYGCYRCGGRGRLQHPLEEYEDLDIEDDAAAPVGIDGPPEGFLFLDEEPAYSARTFDAAWDYLLASTDAGGRGLTEAQVSAAALGVCSHGRFYGRIVIPVFDPDGKWCWYVGRAWRKKAEKPYLYPQGARAGILYNHAALFVATDEPLLMVEGGFDAIPFRAPVGQPEAADSAAFLGKPTDGHMVALEAARRPIVFCLDGDAHAEAWALMMRLQLAGVRAGSIKLPPRVDPDEVPDRVRARMYDAVARGEVLL